MAHELIYTSAPRGLRSGAQGFCTVAMTTQMPPALAAQLEALSGYKPIYPPGQAGAALNPPAFAHWRLEIGGQTLSILSRVALAGLDYTQRTSKLAHHLALEWSEQPAAGPAWVMRQPGVMQSQWNDEPHYLSQARSLPTGPNPPRICRAWETACGDAGWAGVLAQAFVNDPNRPAYLLYEPGLDVLALIDEAMALLGPAQRWQVTFNTHFSELPAHLSCVWRCCAAGAAQAPRPPDALIIDLTCPLGTAPSSPYVQSARIGQPVPSEPTPTMPTIPPEIEPHQVSPHRDEAHYSVPEIPPAPAILRTRPRQALWASTMVWPLLAAVLAGCFWLGIWVNQQLHQTPVPPTPPELIDLRARYNELKADSDALRRQLDLAHQWQAEKSRPIQAPALPASSMAEAQKIQDLLDQLRQRDAQIAELRAQLLAANAPKAAKSTSSSPATQVALARQYRATAAFPEVPADLAVQSPQRILLDASAPKWNGKTPTGVTLLLPAAMPELVLSPTLGGCVLTLKGKNNIGGDKSDDLLEIKFQDGSLWWTWRQFGRLAQTEPTRALAIEKMLRRAAVQVVDATNTWSVQFHPVTRRVFHLGQTDPQLDDMAKELRAEAGWGPTLAVQWMPPGWTAMPDEQKQRIVFRSANLAEAAFVVELNTGDQTLASNWLLIRDQAQRQQDQSRQDREVYQRGLPQRTDAEIAKLDPDARRPYDIIRQHIQDEQRLAKVMQTLDEAGKMTLQILLPRSQVVLEQVELEK